MPGRILLRQKNSRQKLRRKASPGVVLIGDEVSFATQCGGFAAPCPRDMRDFSLHDLDHGAGERLRSLTGRGRLVMAPFRSSLFAASKSFTDAAHTPRIPAIEAYMKIQP